MIWSVGGGKLPTFAATVATPVGRRVALQLGSLGSLDPKNATMAIARLSANGQSFDYEPLPAPRTGGSASRASFANGAFQVDRDELIVLLGRVRRSGESTWRWALIDSAGNPLAHSDQPIDAAALLGRVATPSTRAAVAPGVASADGNDVRRRDLGPVFLFSSDTGHVDLADKAGLSGRDVYAVWSTSSDTAAAEPLAVTDEPSNGGRITVDAANLNGLRSPAVYTMRDRAGGETVWGTFTIYRIRPIALLAAVLVLAVFVSFGARAFAVSFLRADDVGIALKQGERKAECPRMDVPVRATGWADGGPRGSGLAVTLRKVAPSLDCPSGHRLEVTADRTARPGSYPVAYGVAYEPPLLGRQSATLTVHVGEAPRLTLRTSRHECIPPGSSKLVDLAEGGSIDAKGLPLTVRDVNVQLPLLVAADPSNRPLHRELRAPPAPHLGELVYEFQVLAGGITSGTAFIRINSRQHCPGLYAASSAPGGSSPTPPAGRPGTKGSPPTSGASPPGAAGAVGKGTGGTQTPPSTGRPIVHTRGRIIVPAAGGVVLAYEGADIVRSGLTALPPVRLLRVPSDLTVAVAGQFLVIDGAAPGSPARELQWDFEHRGRRHEMRATIVHDRRCETKETEQRLVLLPRGRYRFPPLDLASERERSAMRHWRELLGKGNEAYEAASVDLHNDTCIQTREQPKGDRRVRFSAAERLAKELSKRSGGKTYAIPLLSQWLAGMVLAVDLHIAKAGNHLDAATMRVSYLDANTEWTDTPPSPSKPKQRIILGYIRQGEWAKSIPTTTGDEKLGVRLVREP